MDWILGITCVAGIALAIFGALRKKKPAAINFLGKE